jgi:hypothetical protein
MKIYFILGLLLITTTNISLAKEQIDGKLVKFMTNAAKTLGGEKSLGTKVTPTWQENSEIKNIKTFNANKRNVFLWIVTTQLDENEEKIFTNIEKNQYQLAGSIISRIISLNYLNTLLTDSDDDLLVKDYISGEIYDLKLILATKLQYGFYIKEHKRRKDKLELLLMASGEGIIKEALTLIDKNNTSTQVVANMTILIALMDTCANNEDLCTKF